MLDCRLDYEMEGAERRRVIAVHVSLLENHIAFVRKDLDDPDNRDTMKGFKDAIACLANQLDEMNNQMNNGEDNE